MADLRTRFLAQLREHVDEWHAGDIDIATFTACRDDTWEEIRAAGAAIETEVLRTLCDQLPTMKRR
jgi:hypothetical protein